ncbi:protein translocase subunit SecF [Aestuariispira insulae]|uniref:Protein-export membrane protein SecF n=1 Tax=Aestuariispira insulae TaxID=1461337 RepID=A0A3D9HQ52_9PROT|nr:protein translocase subunit SecF [Aestuariispira insulae]RED51046.1 protein translocase subunit secF [Aestuariispira insulae]
MKLLKLIPDTPKIDFTGKRVIAFAFSVLLVLGSLGLFFGKGLNLGIDFLGGIQIEIQTEGPADISAIRSTVGGLDLGDVSIQEFGETDNVLIRIQEQAGGEESVQAAIEKVKAALGDTVKEYRRTESVGPTVGAELQEAALWAVVSAVGAILIYIWFRFEWQFGVAAVIALTHDVITTIGLFSLLQLDFNLATIAALLTIAGYSINDTVVVFDRVRENMRKYKKMELAELFNLSVNQTLSRTLITSVTTMLALVALGVFGGEVLRGFSIALIWGVLIGTYSSIALAVPVLLYMNPDRGEEEDSETNGAEAQA